MPEIATCPKCRKSIDDTHAQSWCTQCGEPLPEEIKNRLPRLVSILAAGSSASAAGSLGGRTDHRSSHRSSVGDVDSYKVVPFIGQMNTGFFSSDNANTIANQLSAAIAQQAQDGWLFHSLAKVDVEIKPGCLASLFGAGLSYVTFDQLIFRAQSYARSDPGRRTASGDSASLVSPETRAQERAQGIVRCKRCDKRIPRNARQVCMERELCEDHL